MTAGSFFFGGSFLGTSFLGGRETTAAFGGGEGFAFLVRDGWVGVSSGRFLGLVFEGFTGPGPNEDVGLGGSGCVGGMGGVNEWVGEGAGDGVPLFTFFAAVYWARLFLFFTRAFGAIVVVVFPLEIVLDIGVSGSLSSSSSFFMGLGEGARVFLNVKALSFFVGMVSFLGGADFFLFSGGNKSAKVSSRSPGASSSSPSKLRSSSASNSSSAVLRRLMFCC